MFPGKLIILSFFAIFPIVDPFNKFATRSSAQLFNNGVTSRHFQFEMARFIGESILASQCSAFIVIDTGKQSKNGTFCTEISTKILFQIANLTSPTATTLISNINSHVTKKNNLLKYISSCNFVVTMIHEMTSNFSDSFLTLLTSATNNELTKRDEDYYIFVTPSKTVSKLVLGSDIGVQLHFKLVIHPHKTYTSSENDTLPGRKDSILMMNTICIYCPNNKIVSLSFSKTFYKFEQQQLLLSQMFPDFTRNMHRYSIRISAPTKYLPTYQMENVNGEYKHKRGIHTLNFNAVAEKINLSYTLQPCTKFGKIPEGASGVYLGNGSWAGCMGDVVRGISDMALSISPDNKRFGYVRFSSAMEYTYVTFTTSKPAIFFSWTSVFTALTAIVWVFMISSILVTSTAITLIDHYHYYQGSYTSGESMMTKLLQTGMYLMGYVVGQDVPCPKSFPSKFLYVSWLAYGLIIGAAYSCSLQAVIVSPGLDYIPRTFAELVHSHYKWGASTAFRNGLGEQLFKNSDNRIMRDIYATMEGDKDTITCTRKALSEYACFNWELMERFIFETEFVDKSGKHPFQMSTDTAFFVSLNFITRKRELFLPQFNDFFKRSFDSGLVKQTIARDWRGYRMSVVKTRREKHTQSTVEKEEGPRSFRFDNVKGAFIVLGCGLMTGGVSVFFEQILLVYNRRKISL